MDIKLEQRSELGEYMKLEGTIDMPISRRDFFSAMALQGLLASGINERRSPAFSMDYVAQAIHQADRLITELDKPK